MAEVLEYTVTRYQNPYGRHGPQEPLQLGFTFQMGRDHGEEQDISNDGVCGITVLAGHIAP